MDTSLKAEWETLVGSFILSCGDIELFLLQLYWNLAIKGRYEEQIKYMGLGDKVKFIKKSIDKRQWSQELLKKISTALDRATNLAHKRNLVAHNPLYMDIYSDEKGNFIYIPTIRSLRDTKKHISIKELRKISQRANELSSELQNLVGMVSGEL